MRIQSLHSFLVACVITLSLSSCATIFGGAKYNAEVIVEDHPKAQIHYNGQFIGTGRGVVKIERKNANKIFFIVKEDGKKEQNFAYQRRVFRGWSFVGTVLEWTSYTNGLFFPWGVVLDGLTGSWWKPDENEDGIVKIDYDNFRYFLKYNAEDDGTSKPVGNEKQDAQTPDASIEIKLEQIKSLRDRKLISDEEYNRMRSSIIENF